MFACQDQSISGLKISINDAISKLDSKNYEAFLQENVSPIDRQSITQENLDYIRETTGPQLLMALKVVRDTVPSFDNQKVIATYDVSALNLNFKKLNFVKYDGKWYLMAK